MWLFYSDNDNYAKNVENMKISIAETYFDSFQVCYSQWNLNYYKVVWYLAFIWNIDKLHVSITFQL